MNSHENFKKINPESKRSDRGVKVRSLIFESMQLLEKAERDKWSKQVAKMFARVEKFNNNDFEQESEFNFETNSVQQEPPERRTPK